MIGRRVLGVRICTCMKRDLKHELEAQRKSGKITDRPPAEANGEVLGSAAAPGSGKAVLNKNKPMWVLVSE